jgi:hypothetical protein
LGPGCHHLHCRSGTQESLSVEQFVKPTALPPPLKITTPIYGENPAIRRSLDSMESRAMMPNQMVITVGIVAVGLNLFLTPFAHIHLSLS